MRYIRLAINATGCTSKCRHCNVGGSPPFGELMSLEDMRWVVGEFERALHALSPQRPIGIRLGVPHEPTAHPHFLGLYEYLVSRCPNPEVMFSLLNSNGWGVARWGDWQDILSRLKAVGVTGMGTAVHGLAKEHDWFCRRPGAFEDLMVAGRRVLASGMQLTLEIHLNKRNLEQIGPLVRGLQESTDNRARIIWSVSTYAMNDRSRALEALRPTQADLSPVLDELLDVYDRDLPWTEAASLAWLCDAESDLGLLYEAYEPARRETAKFGSDAGERSFGDMNVTPDFEVVETFCSRAALHHGALKTDGIDRVCERILDVELPPMPEPAELARRFGDPGSDRLHDGISAYLKCCDAYRRHGEPSPDGPTASPFAERRGKT